MRHELRRTWVAVAVGAGVAACGGDRPDYSALSTPPEVSFANAPPAYTASATLPLAIAARNPTGVRAVYALSGSQRFAARQQGDGTWVATVQLPVIGKNTVTVWAEDMASPMPNSGQGMDAPYQLVQDVLYDPTPPSVSYDAAFASYSDERNLQLDVDQNGIATVPPAYVAGAKVGVLPGGDFYKAWSRLSAGADDDGERARDDEREQHPGAAVRRPVQPEHRLAHPDADVRGARELPAAVPGLPGRHGGAPALGDA